MDSFAQLAPYLDAALAARRPLLASASPGPIRLFNGFFEGCPELVIDLYGSSLVLFDYADTPGWLETVQTDLLAWLAVNLPLAGSVLLKTRRSPDEAGRKGRLLSGRSLDEAISENGVQYALDLRLNQDCSFYLDTRELRRWLREKMRGKRVLNTFAYTGSLGAAALAGGAARVLQTDRTRRFLDLAQATYRLNGWRVEPADLICGDFFRVAGRLKKAGSLFDCVILDPPFFSTAEASRVDLQAENDRLINKVRPLVAHDGWLVAVNNSIFTSGRQYLDTLERLCSGGYLAIETLLPAPEDVTGYPATRLTPPPADPAPFNHPTKIAVLRVSRKDRAAAKLAATEL